MTPGLPLGHALDGFIDAELKVLMDEIKADTGQVEINPHVIDILSKKLEKQEAKAASLLDERNEWSARNPKGKAGDFPSYDALKQALKMVQTYQKRLAAAHQGICYASETTPKDRNPDKRAPLALRAQWPGFIGWLKSLPHGGIARFGKAMNLSADTVGNWVRYGRVPLENLMKLAYAKASEKEWGYNPDEEYTPRRLEPSGAELLQWDSFVAWAKEQDKAFPRQFGVSLGLSTSCVRNWLVGNPTTGADPSIPSPDVMASVLTKAGQMGWVYGATVKPKHDWARWDSLVNWMRAEKAKKHGFLKDFTGAVGVGETNAYHWLRGSRPSPERLKALEDRALALGWMPEVKVEVLTREQVAAAEAAQARLEADGKELEERMLLEKLLKKYPDVAENYANASQASPPPAVGAPVLQNG